MSRPPAFRWDSFRPRKRGPARNPPALPLAGIKVEPVSGGDNTRRLPGSGAGFFVTFNRNKRSLARSLRAGASVNDIMGGMAGRNLGDLRTGAPALRSDHEARGNHHRLQTAYRLMRIHQGKPQEKQP
jgi:hypothetical protein